MKKLFVLFIACLMLASCDNELKQTKKNIEKYEHTFNYGHPCKMTVKRANGTANNIFVAKMYWEYPDGRKTVTPRYAVYSYDENNEIYSWKSTLKFHIIEANFPEAIECDDYMIAKTDVIWSEDTYLATDNLFYKQYFIQYKEALEKEHKFLIGEYVMPMIESLKEMSSTREMLLDSIINNLDAKENEDSLRTDTTLKFIEDKIISIKESEKTIVKEYDDAKYNIIQKYDELINKLRREGDSLIWIERKKADSLIMIREAEIQSLREEANI